MDIFTAIFYFLFRSWLNKKDKDKPNANVITLGSSKMKIKCPKCAREIYIDQLQENEKEKTIKCTKCNYNFRVKKNIK